MKAKSCVGECESKGKDVSRAPVPGVPQLTNRVTELHLDSAQDGGCEAPKAHNSNLSSGAEKLYLNPNAKARGHPDVVQKPCFLGSGGSGNCYGTARAAADFVRPACGGNAGPQSSNQGFKNSSGQTAFVSPPLEHGWRGISNLIQSFEDGLPKEEDVSSYLSFDSGCDSDIGYHVDDSDEDFNTDESQKSLKTCRNNKSFSAALKLLNGLSLEQINGPDTEWRQEACQYGPGAAECYRALQSLRNYVTPEKLADTKLHIELADSRPDPLDRLSCLPSELLLLIAARLDDLRSVLFLCMASKYLSSLLFGELDSIRFSVPPIISNPQNFLNEVGEASSSKKFLSSFSSLTRFTGLQMLELQLPTSMVDSLGRWSILFGSDRHPDTVLFLCPSAIMDDIGANFKPMGVEGFGGESLKLKRIELGMRCALMDVLVRHETFLYFVKNLKFLRRIAVTDHKLQGRYEMGSEDLTVLRNLMHESELRGEDSWLNEFGTTFASCSSHLTSLRLPISRKVMYEVTLVLMKFNPGIVTEIALDQVMFGEGYEAYTEALAHFLTAEAANFTTP